jgi:Calcineurin-like phosphoesterase
MTKPIMLVVCALLVASCVATSARTTSQAPIATTTTTPGTTTPTTTTTVVESTEPEAVEPITFTAAGDIGGDAEPEGVILRAMAAEDADFFLALGDLSYSEITPEAAWCDRVSSFFPPQHPVELVAGNHEDDGRANGFIRYFTACLPDRMGATGDYGVQYFFDDGPLRVIMIAPGISVDGTAYDYSRPGPQRDWLVDRLDEAETAGLWTIVGMHKVCVTTGVKSCEVGEQTIAAVINHGGDLILQGHEHNYQRSHQLACVAAGTVPEVCVVDTDSDFAAGKGAVIAIAGWVGRAGYRVSASDPEAAYFAVTGGPTTAGWGPGYLTVTATATTLTGIWTTVGGGPGDHFSISRTG